MRTKRKTESGRKKPSNQRKVFISPWRIEYILGPKGKGCFLCQACQIPEGAEVAWKEALLLHRGAHGLVMMNRYPYTGGHLLIAPRRHTADLPGLAAEESAYLWEFSRHAVRIIAQVTQAQGYNLGMNLGRAAGSGVEEHLHMHALPRWNGDTNFMHIVADTATVPIALDVLWDKMRPLFRILDF